MEKFEVGKLFREGIIKYEECVKFGFGETGGDMPIFLSSPSEKEIESIKNEKLEIAFYEKDEIIFFLSKFYGMYWMDAPYTVHLAQPFEFMDITEDMGYSLTIFLVDAATGILKAGRYIGLGHKFSIELKNAILRQKELPFNKELYYKKVQDVYANYYTHDLVRSAIHFYKVK